MERYVAFDIGDKRIGVAVSDPFNSYALPSQTYFRKGFKEDVAALALIAKEKGATVEATPLPVVCEDERFTTRMAHETLISEGMRREKRKNCVDALAAANILDGYLSKINKGVK